MPLNSATPQQVAYLSYMSVKGADKMNEEKAAMHIESLMQRIHDSPPESAIRRRQSEWMRDRFKLYPALYERELRQFLDEGLPSSLLSWVGARMKGATMKLNKVKVKQVMKSLSEEDPDWWMGDEYQEVFYQRLSELLPKTVDGKFSEPKPRSALLSKGGGGCFGVFVLGLAGVVGIVIGWPS